MADSALTPIQFVEKSPRGMYVHVDPATIVIHASQVSLTGEGGTAFIPFEAPIPVSIKAIEKEGDTTVDWIGLNISEHGVDLHIGATTEEREARIQFTAGKDTFDVPVTQSALIDRGFSLVSSPVVLLAADDTETAITLQTDEHWTLDCGDSWITYDLTYGHGSAVINVTVEENTEPAMRYGFIKITGSGKKEIVEIRQAAAEE